MPPRPLYTQLALADPNRGAVRVLMDWNVRRSTCATLSRENLVLYKRCASLVSRRKTRFIQEGAISVGCG